MRHFRRHFLGGLVHVRRCNTCSFSFCKKRPLNRLLAPNRSCRRYLLVNCHSPVNCRRPHQQNGRAKVFFLLPVEAGISHSALLQAQIRSRGRILFFLKIRVYLRKPFRLASPGPGSARSAQLPPNSWLQAPLYTSAVNVQANHHKVTTPTALWKS